MIQWYNELLKKASNRVNMPLKVLRKKLTQIWSDKMGYTHIICHELVQLIFKLKNGLKKNWQNSLYYQLKGTKELESKWIKQIGYAF